MSLDPQIKTSGGGLYPATTQSRLGQPVGSNLLGPAPASLLASWEQDSLGTGVLNGLVGLDNSLATGTAALARQLRGSVSAASASSTTVTAPNGSMAAITLSGDTAIAFPVAVSGELFRFRLAVIQNATGGWVFTFPAAVSWITGTRPVPPVSPGASGVYDFFTVDGGTTWLASIITNPPTSDTIIYDDFQRANSASSLGAAFKGGNWVADRGTWGILNNQGYLVTDAGSGNNVATLDAGVATQNVQCDVTGDIAGTWNIGIVARAIANTDGYYLFLTGSAAVGFWRFVGGAGVSLSSFTIANALGQVVRLRLNCSGNNVVASVNGTVFATDSSGTGAAQTQCGLFRGSGFAFAPGRWDNFIAR